MIKKNRREVSLYVQEKVRLMECYVYYVGSCGGVEWTCNPVNEIWFILVYYGCFKKGQ